MFSQLGTPGNPKEAIVRGLRSEPGKTGVGQTRQEGNRAAAAGATVGTEVKKHWSRHCFHKEHTFAQKGHLRGLGFTGLWWEGEHVGALGIKARPHPAVLPVPLPCVYVAQDF